MASQGAVVSIQERISGSRRAAAVDRAWKVAKSLEGEHQLAALKWIEPVSEGKGGLSRRIDFEKDFPQGVSTLLPLPINFNVFAPSSLVVPNEEGMSFAWTMPLLVRTRPEEPIPSEVSGRFGWSFYASRQKRPIIEVVTFLPFPRAGAPQEEQFTPQFVVSMDIDRRQLGSEDNYFGSMVRFGGKVVSQFVTSQRTSSLVFADPYHSTPFRAELLATLSQDELASTPENAGTLDIFIYRLSKVLDIKSIISTSESASQGLSSTSWGQFRGLRGDYTLSAPSRGLTSISGGGQKPSLPSPSKVQKEVGDTRVGEGTQGEAVKFDHLEGYGFDSNFPMQQISIRVLGVREGAREALVRTLESIC
ncbi:MAG: hypothetical protein AABW86_00300 [Candidatus Micrarchaeota archaeon]